MTARKTAPAAPPVTADVFYPGGNLRASAAQQQAIEQAEADHLAVKLAELHDMLGPCSRCRCCGADTSQRTPAGLCRSCSRVVAQLEAEQAAGDLIGGRTRRHLAEDYLTTWSAP
jgi:hypothetical protein